MKLTLYCLLIVTILFTYLNSAYAGFNFSDHALMVKKRKGVQVSQLINPRNNSIIRGTKQLSKPRVTQAPNQISPDQANCKRDLSNFLESISPKLNKFFPQDLWIDKLNVMKNALNDYNDQYIQNGEILSRFGLPEASGHEPYSVIAEAEAPNLNLNITLNMLNSADEFLKLIQQTRKLDEILDILNELIVAAFPTPVPCRIYFEAQGTSDDF